MVKTQQTLLYDLHNSLGAKFVPFAGYDMPVQYEDGVMKEHLHTRNFSGVFDVSHMGQIIVRPKGNDFSDTVNSLESLMPSDLKNLKKNRQCYSFFTNKNGGLLDDLMISNRGDHFFIVVNASRKIDDLNHLKDKIGDTCHVEMLQDRSLLAVQGPMAETVLEKLSSQFVEMNFLDVKNINILGSTCWVSRSGYTGEDGFELSIENESVERITKEILSDSDAKLIGLGARDSLRLEAGLCLYGNELNEETTPVQASLNWAIHKERKIGGSREGGFVGANNVLRELRDGTKMKRIALLPEGRGPMREGCQIFESFDSNSAIGFVTSGGFSPTLKKPISMGYIESEFTRTGLKVFVELRGKRMIASISDLPFVSNNYKRKKGSK